MKTIKNLKRVRENMGVVALTARDTVTLWGLLEALGKFKKDGFGFNKNDRIREGELVEELFDDLPEKVKSFLPGISWGLDISILHHELQKAVDYYKLDK